MIVDRKARDADRHYAIRPSPAFFLCEFAVANPLDGFMAAKRMNFISDLQFLHWTIARGSRYFCPLQYTVHGAGRHAGSDDLSRRFLAQRKEGNARSSCSHYPEQLPTRAHMLPQCFHHCALRRLTYLTNLASLSLIGIGVKGDVVPAHGWELRLTGDLG